MNELTNGRHHQYEIQTTYDTTQRKTCRYKHLYINKHRSTQSHTGTHTFFSIKKFYLCLLKHDIR